VWRRRCARWVIFRPTSSMSRVDLGRVVRKGDVRRSATGFAVLGGWRSRELEGTMFGSKLRMGSGPTLLAMLRHDRRHFSLEGRLGIERESVGSSTVSIENQALSLGAAALYPVDLRWLTVAVGAEVGWVLVRQGFSPTEGAEYADVMPPSASLMHPRWSDGLQMGPLVQLDLPIGARGYFRLESGFTYRRFSSSGTSSSDTGVRTGEHVRFLAGAGMSF
jgi:hypothetical protein